MARDCRYCPAMRNLPKIADYFTFDNLKSDQMNTISAYGMVV